MNRSIRVPVRVQASGARQDEPEEKPVDQGSQAQPGEMRTAADRAEDQETDWLDLAMRLQAEMENFRKRQQRLAQDQIQAERERLLGSFLHVVDDLERALATSGDGQGLREGLQLTHRTALQLLAREGVERMEAVNRPFDPTWQEAVATVAHHQANAAPETVVQALSPGYRLDNHLLRPARVIVAI